MSSLSQLRFTIVDWGERGSIRTRTSLADLDELSFPDRVTCPAQGSRSPAVDVTFTAADSGGPQQHCHLDEGHCRRPASRIA